MTKEKTQKNHRVNVKVKGRLYDLSYKLRALIKASHLGLKTHKLIKHRPGNLEMEFEGNKVDLWKIVKWSKGGTFFSSVEEVTFTFSAPAL